MGLSAAAVDGANGGWVRRGHTAAVIILPAIGGTIMTALRVWPRSVTANGSGAALAHHPNRTPGLVSPHKAGRVFCVWPYTAYPVAG